MKIKFSFFILLVLSIGAAAQGVGMSSRCEIKAGKGIDELSLELNKLEEVMVLLGKTEVITEKYEKKDGGNQYLLKYKERGITVRYRKVKRNIEIIGIQVNAPYTCKTKDGIGIGTSKEELIEKMGRPNDLFENDTESHLDYKGIFFLLTKNKDNKFVIEKIQVAKE